MGLSPSPITILLVKGHQVTHPIITDPVSGGAQVTLGLSDTMAASFHDCLSEKQNSISVLNNC